MTDIISIQKNIKDEDEDEDVDVDEDEDEDEDITTNARSLICFVKQCRENPLGTLSSSG